MDALRALWLAAGLQAVATRQVTVSRTFSFDDYWATASASSTVQPVVARLTAAEVDRLKKRVGARLGAEAGGRITITAPANAVRGRVPGTIAPAKDAGH